MNKRIIGIDVARALAIIGMILVNFKMVFGQKGSDWLQTISSVFDGKAAATFVVLAGVGLAFMTNTAIVNNDTTKLKRAHTRIFKRALFLFVVGLSYIFIWPADILHFYGIYMLVVLLLLKARPQMILLVALLLILLYPVLMVLFDYDTGWDFSNYTYLDFWTLEGFFRNLFYNGFHPVIPWSAFMLVGLWFGRQNLHDMKFIKKALLVSLLVFVAVKLLSISTIGLLAETPEDAQELTQVLGTSPMPPLPVYMISGSSIAIAIISACIILSKHFEKSKLILALTKTGQLALTFYVADVVFGMGLIEVFSDTTFGDFSLEFSVIYALVFSISCIVFAVLWTRYKTSGPLEWLMRKITN